MLTSPSDTTEYWQDNNWYLMVNKDVRLYIKSSNK